MDPVSLSLTASMVQCYVELVKINNLNYFCCLLLQLSIKFIGFGVGISGDFVTP